MTASAAKASSPSPLGIIAGAGALPVEIADYCKTCQRGVAVVAFEQAHLTPPLAALPHAVVRLGAVGEALAFFRAQGVEEIVMAGSIKRPSLLGLRPDAAGARLMGRLGSSFFGGDDKILRTIIGFLEEEGFRVVGSQDVLGGAAQNGGALGKFAPHDDDLTDIAEGFQVAKTLGALDIGQAVIVERGYVLAVEAAEGTEAMIARAGKLKRAGMRAGVLVKAKKPGQETRADLPAIGPDTIVQLHAAGLAGVAVEKDGAVILQRDVLVERADSLGVFVFLAEAGEFAP